MALTVIAENIQSETRWRWLLIDENGMTRRCFDVDLDSTAPEFKAFVDFSGYLAEPDHPPYRQLAYETERVDWLGTWIGDHVLGRELGRLLRGRTVVIRTRADARFLLDRPLELAIVDGEALARCGTVLVHEPMDDSGPEDLVPDKERLGDELRMLALFSRPPSETFLDVRRERWMLTTTIRRYAARTHKRIKLEVLDYGVTRDVLLGMAQAYPGWDLLHISGHGRAGSVLLENRDGSADPVPAANLVDLLRPTKDRLKFAVLSACHSAAGGPGGVVSTLVEGFRRDLDCAVLAMRYPVRDGFAVALSKQLYWLLIDRGQPVDGAVRGAVPSAAGATPSLAVRPLSIGTPALFGASAIGLSLTPQASGASDRTPAPPFRGPPPYFPDEPDEFVGRTAVLMAASAALALGSGRTGVLLYGPAGVGKTYCATELSYRRCSDLHSEGFGSNLAWWAPPPKEDDPRAVLNSLANACHLQLGWPKDLGRSVAQFDAWLQDRRSDLRHGRILLVLDGLHVLMSKDATWLDPLFGRLIECFCGHGGDSRLVLTSHAVPIGLPASIDRQPVGRLPRDPLAQRLREAPRWHRLFADVGIDRGGHVHGADPVVHQVLGLLEQRPQLIGPLVADTVDVTAIREIAAALRLDPEETEALDAALDAVRVGAAGPVPAGWYPSAGYQDRSAPIVPSVVLSDAQERLLIDTLAELGADRVAEQVLQLDKRFAAFQGPASDLRADLLALVRDAQRHDWILPLVEVVADRDRRLAALHDRLLAKRTAAPLPSRGDHLVVATTFAPDGAAFAAALRERLVQTPLPVEPWWDDDAAAVGGADQPLRRADLLLFVMTAASTTAGSPCREEVDRAAGAGIDVIALVADARAGRPDWARHPLTIDFTHDEQRGWADLDAALRFAGSAERRRQVLQIQYDALSQDASAAADARYAAALREVDRRIVQASLQLDDPAGTQRRKADAINAGKAAEREPERPALDEAGLRWYHEPPAVPQDVFQDREQHMRELERMLVDPAVRMITLVGPPGIGKTGMAARLLANLRAGTAALRLDGFCYLPVHGARPVNAPTLLRALIHMVRNDETAGRLADRLAQPVAWSDLLDEVLDGLGDSPVVVVIDNAEDLLDDAGRLDAPDLQEMIDRLLERRDHGVRPVLVSQRLTAALVPRGAVALHLAEGLAVKDATRFLVALDAEDLLGLRSVPEHDLSMLHRLTGGSPRSLELAFGLLTGPSGGSVRDLVDLIVDEADVGRYLLRRTVDELDFADRRIVQALAIYGRPVQPAAVDHLLSGYLQGPGSAAGLRALYRKRLVQRDHDGNYYVPPEPDRELVLRSIPTGQGLAPGGRDLRRPQFIRKELWSCAAEYFFESRPPDKQIRGVEDLRTHFAEIDLRIQAEEHEAALKLIGHIDCTYLHRWGRSSTVVQALDRLDGAFTGVAYRTRDLELRRLCSLLWAYTQQKNHNRIVECGARARTLARALGNRPTEATVLIHLANSHRENGSPGTATRLSRLALRKLRWPNRGTGTELAWAHAGLMLCYATAGNFRRALRHHAKAVRHLGAPDRSDAAPTGAFELAQLRTTLLADAGLIYTQLGRYDEAREQLDQASRAAEAAGLDVSLGQCHHLAAQLLLNERRFTNAIRSAEEAAAIGVRAANQVLCRDAREVLTLAYLGKNDLVEAAAAASAAVRYRPRALSFALQGLVAFRRPDFGVAAEAFRRARDLLPSRTVAADFQVADVIGLVLAGLALSTGRPDLVDASCSAYRTARSMTRARGVEDRNMLLLDQFVEHADRSMVSRIRAAARGGAI